MRVLAGRDRPGQASKRPETGRVQVGSGRSHVGGRQADSNVSDAGRMADETGQGAVEGVREARWGRCQHGGKRGGRGGFRSDYAASRCFGVVEGCFSGLRVSFFFCDYYQIVVLKFWES